MGQGFSRMLQTVTSDVASNQNTPLKKHNFFLKDDVSTMANSNKRNSGSSNFISFIFNR